MPAFGGTKWGPSSAFGTDGGVVTWSITPPGTDITRFQEFGAQGSVSVDPSSYISIDYVSELRRAFDRWADFGNVEFIQVQDRGTPAATRALYSDIRISFGLIDGQGGALDGYGFYPPPNGGYDGDILLDITGQYNADPGYFFELALHEIGHGLGLDHVEGPNVMNPQVPVTDLQPDDIQGIQTIYGAQDNGPNTYVMPGALPNVTVIDGTYQLSIIGNDLDNIINGTGDRETVAGGLGNDVLRGFGANDDLIGGFGHDTIEGGFGSDLIYGNQETDSLIGGEGHDTIFGGQNDGPIGVDGVRRFGVDTIGGGAGFDLIYGNHGNDLLFGDTGNDTIFGGQNDDQIIAGPGDDLLLGNLGADTFFFGVAEGFDTIVGFNAVQGDRLGLEGQSYSERDTADGLILDLSGGGSVLLMGLHTGQFSPALVV